MDNIKIDNNFKYHAPKTGQPKIYQDIRNYGKEYAHMIINLCPESRERSIALTKLEECVMWVNAGIARNG